MSTFGKESRAASEFSRFDARNCPDFAGHRGHGSVEVLLSTYILDELRRALPWLAHRHGLTPAEIGDLVDVLSIQAKVIKAQSGAEKDLRGIDDQPVLGTLLAALNTTGADYLVTGDNDLLALGERYPIVTPAKFWAMHAGP